MLLVTACLMTLRFRSRLFRELWANGSGFPTPRPQLLTTAQIDFFSVRAFWQGLQLLQFQRGFVCRQFEHDWSQVPPQVCRS